MSKIVYFFHPGAEPVQNQISYSVPRREYIKKWNTGTHCRNFIKSRGEYVDAGGQKHSGDLVFWGEWEPKARVVEDYDYGVNGVDPTRLVEPIACNPPANPTTVWNGCQNVDPFVFGEHFRYSNCKQHALSSRTILRSLQKGDMILFGSGKNGIFWLDTVFVVDEGKIPFIIASDLSKIPDFDVYNHYVLSCTGLPVQSPNPGKMFDPTDRDDPHYVYYPGKKFDPANPDEPFSFSPAKLYGPDCAFRKIPLKETRGTMGIKCDNGDVRKVWKAIRDKVLGQGCVLGVHFDLPPLPTSSNASGNSNSNLQGV